MKWTEDDFFHALSDKDDQVAQAARALYEHTRTMVPGGWVGVLGRGRVSLDDRAGPDGQQNTAAMVVLPYSDH